MSVLSYGWTQNVSFNSNNLEAVSWAFKIITQQKKEKPISEKGINIGISQCNVIKYEFFQSIIKVCIKVSDCLLVKPEAWKAGNKNVTKKVLNLNILWVTDFFSRKHCKLWAFCEFLKLRKIVYLCTLPGIIYKAKLKRWN